MTTVINAIGANPGVYVLVTLRSDPSMIGQDTVDGDPEATGLPSESTTAPNATSFPTGSGAACVSLVDTFANASFVLLRPTNEPGGHELANATISSAVSHADGVIRAEECRTTSCPFRGTAGRVTSAEIYRGKPVRVFPFVEARRLMESSGAGGKPVVP